MAVYVVVAVLAAVAAAAAALIGKTHAALADAKNDIASYVPVRHYKSHKREIVVYLARADRMVAT